MGPDLFIIIINVITEFINLADTYLYADDTIIIFSDSSLILGFILFSSIPIFTCFCSFDKQINRIEKNWVLNEEFHRKLLKLAKTDKLKMTVSHFKVTNEPLSDQLTPWKKKV